jgi:dimethyladenosine transferase 1
VTVVEKDARFLPFLHNLAESSDGRLDVIHGDILEVDFDQILLEREALPGRFRPLKPETGESNGSGITITAVAPLKIIGNLPFGVATPVLFMFLKMLAQSSGPFSGGAASELTLAFQKEVAQRIVAGPGTAMRCRLSLMAQYYCTAKIVYDLPSHVFVPKPKVRPVRAPACRHVTSSSASSLCIFYHKHEF